MNIIKKIYFLFTLINYIFCHKLSLKKEIIRTTSLCQNTKIMNICIETSTAQNYLPSNFKINLI